MKAGRKNTSDKLKVLKGTDQKCRMNGDSAIFHPIAKLPAAPKFLNTHGKKVYRKLGTYLLEMKIINESNLMMFVSLCREYGIYWEAEESMPELSDRWAVIWDKQGNKKSQKTALHIISKEALTNSIKLASEFGLTPASVSKIIHNLIPQGKPKIDLD